MASNQRGIGQNQHDELQYQVGFAVARGVTSCYVLMARVSSFRLNGDYPNQSQTFYSANWRSLVVGDALIRESR
jgi:hypothetical protein